MDIWAAYCDALAIIAYGIAGIIQQLFKLSRFHEFTSFVELLIFNVLGQRRQRILRFNCYRIDISQLP